MRFQVVINSLIGLSKVEPNVDLLSMTKIQKNMLRRFEIQALNSRRNVTLTVKLVI